MITKIMFTILVLTELIFAVWNIRCVQPGYVNFYVGEHAADFREVVFNDAAHLNFTDLPLVSPFFAKLLGVGSVDAGKCIASLQRLSRCCLLCWGVFCCLTPPSVT